MTTDFHRRLLKLLLPHVSITSDREVLLTEAFRWDPSTAYFVKSVELEGNPHQFSVHLIQAAMEADCQLLKPLLETLKFRFGVEGAEEIQTLLGMVDEICAQYKNNASSAPVDKPAKPINASELRRKMSQSLGTEDLRMIVRDLNRLTDQYLDFENLRGEQKSSKILSLIEWLERRKSLPILIDYLRNNPDYAHVLDE